MGIYNNAFVFNMSGCFMVGSRSWTPDMATDFHSLSEVRRGYSFPRRPPATFQATHRPTLTFPEQHARTIPMGKNVCPVDDVGEYNMSTKPRVRMANTGATEARWTRDVLSLLVKLDARGVCSIVRDDRFVPGQMVLWTEFADRYPALDAVKPWGEQLSHELEQALAGRLVEVHVPWVPLAPAWHVELYRRIFRLPPGEAAELPENMTILDKLRDRREIARALRQCPLVPLVPLHRVKAVDGHPITFQWGAGWRRHLLEQERHAGAGSEAEGIRGGKAKPGEGIRDGE